MWKPNRGKLPRSTVAFDEAGERVGYRNVHVRLRNGFDTKAAGHTPWPAAGGRPPTRWSIEPPDPFDIIEWTLA